MAIEQVGLEKLPNIYFKKIDLYDNDLKSFKVSLGLIIVDESVNNSFVWSDDPLIKNFMKFAIIETSNRSLVGELTDGSQSAHPDILKKSSNFDSSSRIHIFGYGDLIKREDADDKQFSLNVSFTKSNETQDLTLFALTYLDHKELSNFLNIKLTGSLASYSGSLTSERVMTDGQVQRLSNALFRPNGELWPGPVHKNGNDWYSGSQQSEDSIKLRRETIKNLKLSDLRKLVFSDRFKSPNQKSTIFSDLHYSFGKDSDLFGLFSVDIKQFVLTKTVFGKKIYGVSDFLFNAVMQSIEINSLEIRRRQVDLRRQTNSLGTPLYAPKDILPYKVIATMKDLEEINLIQDESIRTFSFSDLEMSSKSRGEFVYEVHATLIDNTQNFVESYLSTVSSNLNAIKDEVRRLNSRMVYDYNKNKLRDNAKPPEMDSFINSYYNTVSMLKQVSDEQIEQMKQDRTNSFKGQSYNPNVGLSFQNDYEKIYSSLVRRFGFGPRDLRQHKALPSSSYPPNLIFANKTFRDVIQFSDAIGSYDVLGISGNRKLLEITKDQFKNRAQMEITRFFDTSKSINSEDLFSADDEVSSAIRDLSYSSYLFMAPLKFDLDGQESDIQTIANADIDGVSIKFLKLKELKGEKKNGSQAKPVNKRNANKPKGSTATPQVKRKTRSKRLKFNFRPVALKINQVGKKRNDYREAVQYLGENSEFINIENNLDTSIEATDTQQTTRKIKIANEITANRTKKKFDLVEKNNIIEKIKRSKNYTQDKIRRIPLSIKSIINSRSSAAKNNILESDSDILRDVETKIATEMIFHSNQKIEVLIGYDKAPDGSPILSKPLWGDLTEEMLENKSRLLCRSIYPDDKSSGLETAPEFKLPVKNSNFIILGDGKETQQNQIPDFTPELPEVEAVVFTTSNIITQRGE